MTMQSLGWASGAEPPFSNSDGDVARAKGDLAVRDRKQSGRQMLLEATSALMTELGTPDVSLHQIARSAGVTAPLIKYYFGSKDGLLLALAERDTAQALVQLEALLNSDVDPLTKLRVHIRGIIGAYARYPYLNGLLNGLLRQIGGEKGAVIRASFVSPLISAQRQIIIEGIDAGQFREIDPDLAYFLIVGACQYVFTSFGSYRDLLAERRDVTDLTKDFSTFAVETILRGIRK